MVMAIITVHRLEPDSDTIAMASSRLGIAISPSMIAHQDRVEDAEEAGGQAERQADGDG